MMSILILGLMIFSLAVSGLFLTHDIFIVFFGIILGLWNKFRGMREITRFFVALLFGVICFAVSLWHVSMYESATYILGFLVLRFLFWDLVLFSLIALFVSKSNLDKLVALFIIVLLLISMFNIYYFSVGRTYSDGINTDTAKYVADVMKEDSLSMIRNGEYTYGWYVGVAYYVRNSPLGYGLVHIDVIGVRGVCENDTHVLLYFGVGLEVGFYVTEFGRSLITKVYFDYDVSWSTSLEPLYNRTSVLFSSDVFVRMLYFLFEKSNVTVIVNSTWFVSSMETMDNKQLTFDRSLSIKHDVVINYSDKAIMFMTDVDPNIFAEPKSIFVSYNPSLGIVESILFYKYEIMTVTLLIWVFVVSYQYGSYRYIKELLTKLKTKAS